MQPARNILERRLEPILHLISLSRPGFREIEAESVARKVQKILLFRSYGPGQFAVIGTL